MSRLDAGRVAACYVALWVAHDLADHVVQTDEQAAAKADPRPGHWEGAMLGHLAGYAAAQAAALVSMHIAGVRMTPGRALAGLAFSVVTHGVLDRRWPVVELLRRTGSERFADPRLPAILVDPREQYPPFTRSPAIGTTRRAALPLHGVYLADQALHHAAVAIAAALAAGGRR